MRISVVGTGYLGATHAACLAAWGHEVVGIDRDRDRIASLRAGRVPFHEPGLDELIGGVRFADDPAEVAGCDLHFLCVGTPQAADGSADLSALDEAVAAIAPHVRPESLVVGKSTVPVGTASTLAPRLGRLAWNPEFLREGSAVHDTLHPDRLVFGVQDPDDVADLRAVYAVPIDEGVPVVTTDLPTAELAKVSANLLLATRLSVVNVLAEVCERSGADVADLVEVLGLDERIGARMLTPGLGYGGGCLPKDSRAFGHRGRELGVEEARRLVDVVDDINLHQRSRAAETAMALVDGVSEPTVAVLGAAFKPGTDDIRDSPAVDVARRVAAAGPRVVVYDPWANRHVRHHEPLLAVADDAERACEGADAVLVLTDWPEFRDLDPDRLRRVVRRPRVLDGRHAIDAAKWRAADWQVTVLGRPRS